MALSVARRRHRSLTNPSLIHLFSTSGSQNDTNPQSPPSEEHSEQPQQASSFSSYFSDVKASLRQNHQSQYRSNFTPLRKPTNFNPSISKPTSEIDSFDDIRKSLAEFRLRSSAQTPTLSSSSQPASSVQHQNGQISLHELYQRRLAAESESYSGDSNERASKVPSFDAIRESMRQIKNAQNVNNNGGRGRYGGGGGFKFRKDSEPMKPSVIGGTHMPPLPNFRKEQSNAQERMETEFLRHYSKEELGEKLRKLRPEIKEGEKGWFSLDEFNQRLRKLREIEHNENASRISAVYRELRGSLLVLKEDEYAKKNPFEKVNVLMGRVLKQPDPKEHLVEKYLHTDNMSSAEKLKIELAKVREEFKMSESDCGSARVQVAQLSTRIRHLSSVLHKKDKHSRKGLQEMVQKRKKLLKYLRRTDWDSYCFVLSKLGLRDNPDFKYLSRN